ncbi:MAG: hypothetical protein ACQR33_02620 [Candidatus Saccharibacteria bacterium]
MAALRLVEQEPATSYFNGDSQKHDSVDFREIYLRGQSAYNPAVSGLAEFVWRCGRTGEGAEAISHNLVASQDRHFVATSPYGLHAGDVYGYAATTGISELLYVSTLVSRDGSLTGSYRRTMAALLHAALDDEPDRALMIEIVDTQDKPFFAEAGMQVQLDGLETMARAESLVAIYNSLSVTYDLGGDF